MPDPGRRGAREAAAAVEARREKVAANITERMGLVAQGGGELNATYYLPEDRDDLVIHAVPAGDRERIQAVLHAGGETPPAPVIPVAGRAEIEPFWAQRDVGGGDHPLRCEITLLDAAPIHMQPGKVRTIFARVRNDGPEPWTWGLDGLPPFRLGFRWHGEGLPAEGRAGLPCDVPVGGDAIVPVHVTAPDRPGGFTLELDMLLEHVRWFGSPLAVAVEVVR